MKAETYFYTCGDYGRTLFMLVQARNVETSHKVLREVVEDSAGCDLLKEWSFVRVEDMDWQQKFLESHTLNTLYESLEEVGHA